MKLYLLATRKLSSLSTSPLQHLNEQALGKNTVKKSCQLLGINTHNTDQSLLIYSSQVRISTKHDYPYYDQTNLSLKTTQQTCWTKNESTSTIKKHNVQTYPVCRAANANVHAASTSDQNMPNKIANANNKNNKPTLEQLLNLKEILTKFVSKHCFKLLCLPLTSGN